MNFKKEYLFFVFNLFAALCNAQIATDSVIKQLSVVEVSSIRQSGFISGNKRETIDSTTLKRYSTNNLADLLASESQVFVKSYGMGSSATTSFRGAGANHTAILWNGFNIQSPMLGLVDVSLIPVNFLNEVTLQYGSAGALWGTGAVGGTIHLNNKASFNEGTTISVNTALGSFSDSINMPLRSFSDKQQQVFIKYSKKRLVSSIKLFNHQALNNFPFVNIAQYGKPEQNQTNAELQQYGMLVENYFLLNQKQKINTRVWYQYNDRNIPPSMTQNISTANQKDGALRTTGEWQRTVEKNTLVVRAAYFYEQLNFKDSAINENSHSYANTAITEIENKYSTTKNSLLNIGLNNTYTQATTRDYITGVSQNRTALFANYKIQNASGNWSAVASFRQEVVKLKPVPFIVSIGFEGQLIKSIYLKGNVAKHYRLPAFNDLYWAGQGAKGNPDLKPESGWSEELSVIHKYQLKQVGWELGATAFNRNIKDWIIWLPNNVNIWSPQNVLQVWSRGLEYKVSVAFKAGKFKMQLNGMYNYILSTNENSSTTNDLTLHKQLIYVPIQNAGGSITLAYRSTSISYNQTYVDYRYTTTDNVGYLKPYSLANISLAQTISYNSFQLKLYTQFNNIFKENYQVIAYRAMPLFYCQFGAVLSFNYKPKNQ